MQNESLLTRTKKLLAEYDLHAKKGLGQNFLIEGGVLKKIAAAAELTPTDTVIEVGPGLGVLTETLLEQAGKVIARLGQPARLNSRASSSPALRWLRIFGSISRLPCQTHSPPSRRTRSGGGGVSGRATG